MTAISGRAGDPRAGSHRCADRHVRLSQRTRSAPEPLLSLPRDRERDRPLGRTGRRDGGAQRGARAGRSPGRRGYPHRGRGQRDRARWPRRPRPLRGRSAIRRVRRAGRGGAGHAREGPRSTPPSPAPEGSQLKLNMLLRRLPRLRDLAVSPEEAFAGTFPVNEGYEELEPSFVEAAAGKIPSRPPCELYCHSLTDPSILSPELQAAGAHTFTLFGLHMPARLFASDPEAAKRAAVAPTLESVNSVLGEPLENCLALDSEGARASRPIRRFTSRPSWPCPAATSSTATWPGHSPRPRRRSASGECETNHPQRVAVRRGGPTRRGGQRDPGLLTPRRRCYQPGRLSGWRSSPR
jgi:hypothetical protein